MLKAVGWAAGTPTRREPIVELTVRSRLAENWAPDGSWQPETAHWPMTMVAPSFPPVQLAEAPPVPVDPPLPPVGLLPPDPDWNCDRSSVPGQPATDTSPPAAPTKPTRRRTSLGTADLIRSRRGQRRRPLDQTVLLLHGEQDDPRIGHRGPTTGR